MGPFASSGWWCRHRPAIIAPAGTAAALWIAGELAGARSAVVLALHWAGGLLLAGALGWSAWLRHEAGCHACRCPAHDEVLHAHAVHAEETAA